MITFKVECYCRANIARRAKMDKKLLCRDIGIDCDLMLCGKTEEEVINKAGQHVLAVHGIRGFSKEFYDKARSAIHEGNCDHGDAEEMTSEECGECAGTKFACVDECCC